MKGYKHLTAEQREEVLRIYRETLNTAEVRNRTGASKAQVLAVLHQNGIKPSGATNGACYRHIDDVKRWAAEGVSLSEIGRRIGTTKDKVSAFLRKHGIPLVRFRQAGANNPSWRGGRIVDEDGYVLVYAPDHPHRDRHNKVREHRLVMEQTLGRYLEPHEVVHHKDGDTSNNDPSNLEVFSSNGEHLAVTRAGLCPNWSPEGRQKILEAIRRPRGKRRTSTQTASGRCDLPSPGSDSQTPG